MKLYGSKTENPEYPESFRRELDNLFKIKKFTSGEHLFRQGEVCRHLFYIRNGLVRLYYYSSKGKEITVWFSAEDTLITAIDSFYFHKPTRDYCEALEDLDVYLIPYNQLETLLSNEKGAQTAFYIMYEITRKMAYLIDSIRFQTAEERYLSLVSSYPEILQRASLGQIASFLGITQETLSRIRGKV